MPILSIKKNHLLASLAILCVVPDASCAFQTNAAGKLQQRGLHPQYQVTAKVAPWKLSAKDDSTSDKASSQDEDQEQGNSSLLRLAQLSLEDYEWRNSVFQRSEADRMVEESLARMMGDEAAYVRPMDASEGKIGPLGRFEKSTVGWLKNVIEEEAGRAKRIVMMGGMMVRPKDAISSDGELGPLGFMEKQFVEFLDDIRSSERERSRTKTLRPKDLDESKRGFLGDAELKAAAALREILDAEKLRAAQSKIRDGIVRPIDLPGPMGDFEMAVLEVVKAEKQRKIDREVNQSLLVRPKDSTRKGPFGELEEQAVAAVERLTNEERERLRNIQRLLVENRPMELDKSSPLGIIETIAVGIVRAPILLFQILARVVELLQSEPLADADAVILKRLEKIEEAKRKMEEIP